MNAKLGRNSIGIVGLGLIGASLAAALKPAYELVGVDCDAETAAFASAHGIVDRVGALSSLAGCAAVFVCTPVAAVAGTIADVYAAVGDSAVISDVASVKESLIGTLPAGIRYVGGHPMAGREKGGIREFSPYLLQNAIYVLTRVPTTRDADFALMTELVRAAGAIPVAADAAAHDAAVSKTSHLPHMIAYTLADVAIADELCATVAAGSLRDMTRVAAADPEFWHSVAVANRAHLLADMDRFAAEFARLRAAIADGDAETAKEIFGAGRSKRALLNPAVAHLRPLCVDVEDRTGVLGGVTTLLGTRGINIANIRILNSREGVGGALMLEFLTQDDYDAARQALRDAGYRAD